MFLPILASLLFSSVTVAEDFTKILVTTGSDNDGGPVNATEIIDLSKINAQCESYGSFIDVQKATGGFTESGPLICGGYSDLYALDICYWLSGINLTVVATMSVSRAGAASVVIGDSLWVTGGDFGALNPGDSGSTEFIRPFAASEPGPDLPGILNSHCLVKLNDTTALAIGGHQGDDFSSKMAHYYDFDDEDWYMAPSLTSGRSDHSCGVIMDSENGTLIVVAAGGIGSDGILISTEILIQESDEWIAGPDLPKPMCYSSGVVTNDKTGLLMVGGYSPEDGAQKSIWKLGCFNKQCSWTLMDQELSEAKLQTVSMLVPDSMTQCSNPNPNSANVFYGSLLFVLLGCFVSLLISY